MSPKIPDKARIRKYLLSHRFHPNRRLIRSMCARELDVSLALVYDLDNALITSGKILSRNNKESNK